MYLVIKFEDLRTTKSCECSWGEGDALEKVNNRKKSGLIQCRGCNGLHETPECPFDTG